MSISVIIPTYKRPENLKQCIDSILVQSVLPTDIIVVDSADDRDTRFVIEYYLKHETKINIKYVRNEIDSSAIARNIGAEYVSSDILLFLDDDTILQKDYVEEVLKAHHTFEDAFIVQGNLLFEKKERQRMKIVWDLLWQKFNKSFTLFHNTPGEMKVLKSGCTTFPKNATSIIHCQWASGCNFSIKKTVFDKYKFDQNLMKYSYGEDEDLSFRVFKDYPTSIYLIPQARLIHKGSFNKSAPLRRAIIAEKIYALYFVAKNLNRPHNYLFFIWSEIGNFITDFLSIFIFFSTKRNYFFLKVKYDLYAYYLCVKHFAYIKKLDLRYINNKYIMHELVQL